MSTLTKYQLRPDVPCILCGCLTRERVVLPPYSIDDKRTKPLCRSCKSQDWELEDMNA